MNKLYLREGGLSASSFVTNSPSQLVLVISVGGETLVMLTDEELRCHTLDTLLEMCQFQLFG